MTTVASSTEKITGMKQAKPSPEEFQTLLRFMHGLESILEHGEIPDQADDDPRTVSDWLFTQWQGVGPVWQRVLYAGQTCIDHACDPNAHTLEWKPELKAAVEAILQTNRPAYAVPASPNQEGN